MLNNESTSATELPEDLATVLTGHPASISSIREHCQPLSGLRGFLERYVIVSPDFPNHWKTQLLIRLAGTHEVVLCLLKFWAHCQNRRTHRFTGINPSVFASICGWNGDEESLWEAMLEAKFIEIEGDELVAHQWDEYNGTLISNWKNGVKGGRPKNPPKTHGITDGVSDKSRVDKRREEKSRSEKKDGAPNPPSDGVLFPPDDLKPDKAERMTLARVALFYLNEKACRVFRETEHNLKLICCRLEEVNDDIDGVKAMVDRQCALWKTNPTMCEFLRPETLFGKQKFGGYYDMRMVPVPVNGETQTIDHSKGF